MIIVISHPTPLQDEQKIISQLFDERLEIFHLRKKEYAETDLRRFIEELPAVHFKNIVLHSHYHLAAEYGFKGIHVPVHFKGQVPKGTLSISFHSVEEIQKFGMQFDYGFLGPIFDSISKDGYMGNIDLKEVAAFLKHRKEKIIALGGIDEDKIEIVQNSRFSGIALLGAIWQSKDPVEKYKQIRKKWQKRTIVY